MNKVAFIFSGQGSQYMGMCKNLHDKFDIVRKTFEEANEVLGFDLRKLCFEGSSKELSQTENTQPAILTTSIAQFRVYMNEIGVEPDFLAGHSLGEYSALVCADAIRFADALRLVRSRGKFMQEQGKCKVGAMASIRNINEKIVEEEIYKFSSKGRSIGISNYNGDKSVVISGDVQTVELVGRMLQEKGGEVINLNVSSAFHSSIMEEAASKLKNELLKYSFTDPKFKVLSNVTALPYKNKYQIVDILSEQIVKPVKWQSIMKYLGQNEINILVEFGPKATLRNLVRNNMPNAKSYSYDKEDDVKELKEMILDKNVENISGKHSLISRSLGIAVCTKNINWNNDEYKRGVIEPCERIEKMQQQLEEDGNDPSIEQMAIAIEMLKIIFKTKKTPKDEQLERFNQLFSETDTKKYFQNFSI
jgi:[acyl-carrier-protein] S-malonyltransferase